MNESEGDRVRGVTDAREHRVGLTKHRVGLTILMGCAHAEPDTSGYMGQMSCLTRPP
jgi:hypothetical protein